MNAHKGALRAVALFEAFKGVLALAAGWGVLALFHGDAQRFADALVGRLHLNPAKSTPQVFLRLLENISNSQLWALAGFAALYASLRFIEAYGLWRGRRWAEWLAALSGGIYVPVEIYELTRGVSWIKVAALLLNAAVVAYMCYALWVSREKGRKR
jgi:uncharacterized membrane protein (DUF2068 family)